MILRLIFAIAAALLLSGCTGWWSENRLIPVSARDTAGLAGSWASAGERMILAPTGDHLVKASGSGGVNEGIALALLREEAERDDEQPLRTSGPDRSYLMEVPWTSDDGRTGYLYGLARIGYARDGSAQRMTLFSLVCSRASTKFAARKEKEACVFDNYTRLRDAAFDALAWQEDARMEVASTTWDREREPGDEDEPAADEMLGP
jgi:hypothetical protein